NNKNNTTDDLGHTNKTETGFRPKLRQWATENLDTLRLNVITKLLKVLIIEGHHDLPKTAQTLLGTGHVRMTQVMACKSGNNEKIEALHSSLFIKCLDCEINTEVHTGKMHTNSAGTFANHNTRAVLGVMHSGSSYAALNKLLACVDMPPMSKHIFKKYENEISPALEKAAEECCLRAASEENVGNCNDLIDD
ncbi:hypothetical protein HCN44_010373, partial [Aphidius gifuensis]